MNWIKYDNEIKTLTNEDSSTQVRCDKDSWDSSSYVPYFGIVNLLFRSNKVDSCEWLVVYSQFGL